MCIRDRLKANAEVAFGHETTVEGDSRERKRMSPALYKRVVARMSSANVCPKGVRLRVGLQMHAAFMDTDRHPNIAGLLRGPHETFDAVFDTLVKQIVIAVAFKEQVNRLRDPPELASTRAELLTEVKAKCAERAELETERAEPWREPTRDERKRAVALGREVIEALGDLATDELVAQIAVDCGDGETLEVARATEETLKAAHAAIKAEREAERAEPKAGAANAQERVRLGVALEKRVVARMRQMAIDLGCDEFPTFLSLIHI